MRILTIIALLAFASAAIADSPPDWPEYRVCGEGRWFCADIRRANALSMDAEAGSGFILTMLDKRAELPRVVWEQNYKHPGYGGGFVTTDGRYFAYVDQWFHQDAPVVSIYSAHAVIAIDGAAFGIRARYLEETASHHLWLEENSHGLAARVEGHRLILKLLDGKERVVNLENGEVAVSLPDPDKESIWQERH